jgi:Flp pilus assembly protein TadG
MTMMRHIKHYIKDTSGIAATEAALIFPILLIVLLGVFDLGNGILAAQKTVRASQVTADLVTRSRTISQNELDEAMDAGELALAPFGVASFGVDVASVRFDEDANGEVVWQETRNMSTNGNVLTDVESLAEANNGVVVVTTEYTFTPVFSGFVLGEIELRETAFARGRRSAVVNME